MAGSMKCLKHGSAPHWFGPVPVASSSDWGCIFISPLQQQNHTRKLNYNKLTYTIHPVMQKKKKEKKNGHN